MRALIVNAYNRYNAGDAALLFAGIEHVRSAYPGAEVNYSGLEDPGEHTEFEGAVNVGSARRWAGVEDIGRTRRVSRKIIVLLLALLPALFLRRLIRLGSRFEPLAEIAAVDEADVVVGLGGGYLNGAASMAGTLNVFFLCYPLIIAAKLGSPVVHAPQSFGPFHGRVQRALARRWLNTSEAVVAREQISADVLRELGVRESLIRHGVDSAFDSSGSATERLVREPGVRMRVGITARAWLDADRQARYETQLASFADWLDGELAATVVLLPQVTSPYGGDDDRIVSRRVAALCRSTPMVVEDQLDHLTLRSEYAQLDYLVGTRFHSVIFGLTSGVPAIAIAYEHKTTGIMRDLGLERWVVPIEGVTDKVLRELFSSLVWSRDSYLAHLSSEIPGFQTRARAFVDVLRSTVPAA